jgi:cob(I)alamin adenosyltransferase
VLGAELACESEARKEWLLERERIVRLESWIEELQQEVPLPRKFVLAGENPVSAALDLARTIVRRAERRAAALKEEGFRVRAEAASYLNRLADFLFTLARYAAEKAK